MTCIRAEQLAAIQKFQSVGAPVSGPKLAEKPPQASLGSNAQSPVGSQTNAVVTQQPTSAEQTTAIQKFQSVPAPAQSSAPTLPAQHSTSAEGNSDGGKLIAFLVLLIVVGCGWLLYHYGRAQRRAIVDAQRMRAIVDARVREAIEAIKAEFPFFFPSTANGSNLSILCMDQQGERLRFVDLR